jgi:hypothetical protein
LAAEIAVGEPVCHYGGCHELRPKSTRSGVVWEEVSVEGKLIIAETYLNHLEVNIFLESLLGSCSQRAPSGPFSLACYYMLKLTA